MPCSSRLGWFASVLLSLAAFSLAALAVHRRRGKAKATASVVQTEAKTFSASAE